jgi:hypothetical protein
VVIATEYIGPVRGKPRAGKKKAIPSRSALLTPGLLISEPGEVVFSEGFEKSAGNFQGGNVVRRGDKDSRALAFPPSGTAIWRSFSTPVRDSTTLRFSLEALDDAQDVTVLIWSKANKDNCRYRIGSLRKGQKRSVEFRALEARVGWGMKGPSLEGDVLDNFKIVFSGEEDARVLLDDFVIRE